MQPKSKQRESFFPDFFFFVFDAVHFFQEKGSNLIFWAGTMFQIAGKVCMSCNLTKPGFKTGENLCFTKQNTKSTTNLLQNNSNS